MEFDIHDLIPLLVAVLLGGVVGIERQLGGHGAGLRTHMIVSMAAALFILASSETTIRASADMTRVVQGIAAGVGFIGAGTILKLSSEHEVKGLTTASTIWLAAAVGTASGLREYFLATTGAMFAVIFLVVLHPIEKYLSRKSKQEKAAKNGPASNPEDAKVTRKK
jgi:putative Mg2+ transporter-C (MgtC) family protein